MLCCAGGRRGCAANLRFLTVFPPLATSPSPPGLDPPTDVANIVLYLCAGGDDWDADLVAAAAAPAEGGVAAAPPPASTPTLAARGLAIFDSLKPRFPLPSKDGEMAHTAVARIAARARDPAAALAAARAAVAAGLPPRLRCFAPALMAHCAAGNAASALAVDAEVSGHGLDWGESDLARLLAVAARAPPGAAPWPAIASVLTRLTRDHGRLAPATLDAARALFASPVAAAALPAGHAWRVTTATVHAATGDVKPAASTTPLGRLSGIDLTDSEWESFAQGVADLARARERRPSDFDAFASWLTANGPFDAIIDGANVALFGQNWERGGFDFGQVESVLDALASARPGCRPLVILHRSRTGAPPAKEPVGRALLARLRADNALYAAPHGSNDDWYWLHAAVTAGATGLLVSNDEMRDHAFALLAPTFVARWKDRHQCRYEFDCQGAVLTLPRAFTVCAQWVGEDKESPLGAWVLPPAGEGAWDGWLCAQVVREG